MTEVKRFDYEVVERPPERRVVSKLRPDSVSKVALSQSSILVGTGPQRRRVAFSVIPSDKELGGTSEDARIGGHKILAMEAGHYLLKRIFRGKSVKPRPLEIGIVQPEADEPAEPELVIKEQERTVIGNDDLAFMGDGQRMTVDGENIKVIDFVKSHPDSFPAAMAE